jgi:hypothetical protein
MPRTGIRHSFKMETRNRYTTVDAEIGVTIEGKELPSSAVLGAALEEAVELVQKKITESYKVVPPRVDTPIANPYEAS